MARVAFDRVLPRDLPFEYRAIAIDMFGDLDALPETEILVMRCGRGSGKSLVCAVHGIYRLCYADLSSVGPGKAATVLVLCPTKDDAEELLDTALKIIQASFLAGALRNPTKQRFYLQCEGRKLVQFRCIAKSAKGSTGRGKDIIEAICDESEFIASNDASKVITDTDLVNSMTPRLLKGGLILLPSTPWPAESLTSTLFDENWKNPTTALCAFADTLTMRDHDPYWVEKIAKEKIRDEKNCEREYFCITHGVEDSFLEPELIQAAIRNSIESTGVKTTSGIDLAFKNDASAQIVTDRIDGRVAVVHIEMDVPTLTEKLVPTVICKKYMQTAANWHCQISVADSHYIESAREAAASHKIQIIEGPSMTGDKEHSWLYLRDLFREKKIIIPNHKMLLAQLKSVQLQHQSGGGIKIISPRKAGSGHCDLVAALCNAVWRDRRFGRVIVPKPEGMAKPHTIKVRKNQSIEADFRGRVG